MVISSVKHRATVLWIGSFFSACMTDLALRRIRVFVLGDGGLSVEWVLLCVLGGQRKWVGLCGWVWGWVFDWWGIGCWGVWGFCMDGSDDSWGSGVSLGREGQSFLACPSPVSLLLFKFVDVSMRVSAGVVAVVMSFFFGGGRWVIFLWSYSWVRFPGSWSWWSWWSSRSW